MNNLDIYLFFPKNHSAKKIPQKRAQLLGKNVIKEGRGNGSTLKGIK